MLVVAPAKVSKFRAIADFAGGDLSFSKGATIFVVGEAVNGKYQVSRLLLVP